MCCGHSFVVYQKTSPLSPFMARRQLVTKRILGPMFRPPWLQLDFPTSAVTAKNLLYERTFLNLNYIKFTILDFIPLLHILETSSLLISWYLEELKDLGDDDIALRPNAQCKNL